MPKFSNVVGKGLDREDINPNRQEDKAMLTNGKGDVSLLWGEAFSSQQKSDGGPGRRGSRKESTGFFAGGEKRCSLGGKKKKRGAVSAGKDVAKFERNQSKGKRKGVRHETCILRKKREPLKGERTMKFAYQKKKPSV